MSDIVPGDIIIATEDAYFPRHISPECHYSQQKGDLLMVNSISSDSVSGAWLNGVAYNGRNCKGLGCSFNKGTFRKATPDDPGYVATKETWNDYKDLKIRNLSNAVLTFKVMTVTTTLMSIWVISSLL